MLAALVLCGGLLVSGCQPGRTVGQVEEVRGPETGELEPATADTLEGRFERVRRMFVVADTPVFQPATIALEDGEPLDRAIELQDGFCYTFLAVAESGAGSVSLALHEPTGREVVRDAGTMAFPILQDRCVEESGTWTLRLRAARPPAVAMLGAFRVTDEGRGESAAAIEALATRYAPGMRAEGPIHTEVLIEGEERGVPVMLLPGQCYAFLASGPAETLDLPVVTGRRGAAAEEVDVDAILYNPAGIRFSQDIGVDRTPVLVDVCPDQGGTWRYVLAMYRGTGPVHWQLWSRPAEAPFPPSR